MTSEVTQEHRRKAARSITVSILTVSDTRTLEDDLGGQLIERMVVEAGHGVCERRIVPDETLQIRSVAKEMIDRIECEALLHTRSHRGVVRCLHSRLWRIISYVIV